MSNYHDHYHDGVLCTDKRCDNPRDDEKPNNGPSLELRFVECDACRTRPPSIQLCAGCLHNRTVIARLNPTSPAEFAVRYFMGNPKTSRAFEVLKRAKLIRYYHGGGRLCIDGDKANNYATRELVADFYNEDTRELIMSLIDAAVNPVGTRARLQRAEELLMKAHDYSYNPFEPDNQSASYKELHAFLFPADGEPT